MDYNPQESPPRTPAKWGEFPNHGPPEASPPKPIAKPGAEKLKGIGVILVEVVPFNKENMLR